ncbi:hypothetical protein Taro_000573 [Colocasia esculenta]|uniref:CCHC-type domain-containing protein n=1 Tax=Colocasia esculenta TaxID=4460 RepID=A0A843TI20_COLES|nr:hypothetical protein [Colocasia esculenta]
MVKKSQLLEDATDFTYRIKGKFVKKEMTFGPSPAKPTNGKKRPFNITEGPSQERKPKAIVPNTPAKSNCKHCDKPGHTADECWRKVGTWTNIYCKGGVDTPHTGVDTMFQALRQKMKKWSTSVDTRPGQVDTRDRSQTNM